MLNTLAPLLPSVCRETCVPFRARCVTLMLRLEKAGVPGEYHKNTSELRGGVMRLEAGATHYVLHSLEDQAEFSSEMSDLAEYICPLSTDGSNQEVRTVFARCLWVPLRF